MSRFIRSALFPILIVIIVAMFIEWVINGNQAQPVKYTYQGGSRNFVSDLNAGRIATVEMNTKSQTLNVTTKPQPPDNKAVTYQVNYPDNTQTATLLQAHPEVTVVAKNPSSPWWTSALTFILPFVLIIGFWIFFMNQMQGGGSKVMSFGKSRAKRVTRGFAQGHVQGRGRRRRGRRGTPGDQGVPREPQEVPAARGAHPQGRAALRPARHRQDAARQSRGRRGGRAVLQHQRL